MWLAPIWGFSTFKNSNFYLELSKIPIFAPFSLIFLKKIIFTFVPFKIMGFYINNFKSPLRKALLMFSYYISHPRVTTRVKIILIV